MSGYVRGYSVADRVRVLIADDQRLFAEALEAILTTDGRITVVGGAQNGQEAVDAGASSTSRTSS